VVRQENKMNWNPFRFNDAVYCLNHLRSQRKIFEQAAKGDKQALQYKVDVIFGLHCFTRGIKADEVIDDQLLYSDSRESRIFDFQRYELSKQLPSIVETLVTRKCSHSGKGNFFTIELLTADQEIIQYEVFFEVSRSTQKGVLNLFVQSAYVRDELHRSNTPKKKPIGFLVILHNILNNKPIKIQT
jgi:hypothetical protein